MQIDNKIIERGIKYSDYYHMVEKMVEEGKTTGSDQSEAMIHYTFLNLQRMKRLNKIFEPNADLLAEFKDKHLDQTWLVLTEAWCGDAAQIIPIISKIADAIDGVELQLIWRDENLDLMNQFLTNGALSIPKLIVVDNSSLELMDDWGPRPQIAQQMMLDNKKDPDPEFKNKLHLWYARDRGLSTEKELIELLKRNS